MAPEKRYDAVIVGAGPNGLSAAVALARAGLSTLVVEASESPGGGARTEPLTLPGFLHDTCSAVHPLGAASPFFRELDLGRHGLSWVEPPAPLAHVLKDGRAVLLERSVDRTAAQFGGDASAYRSLFRPFVDHFDELVRMILGPLRLPSDPALLAEFGLQAMRSMRGLARARFRGEAAAALLAGIASHAMVPLGAAASASFALVLAAAGHAVGWPIARGGSRAITAALAAHLAELGGHLVLGQRVERLDQLPAARAYLFDLTPRQLLAVAGDALPSGYRRRLERFRYGQGVFKVDWALRGPVPWRDPACARAATVHLSGDFAEVEASEAAVHGGALARQPFVLFAQPSLFDPSRAPPGKHVAWGYCHVPHSSSLDVTEAIEAHVERFAPGFKDLVLARACRSAVDMERHNPNYVGGDIGGGLSDLGQLFFRPVARLDPYSTPAPNIFLCSSSTPPGGAVHGMCGYWAAKSVLARVFGRKLGREGAQSLPRSGPERGRSFDFAGAKARGGVAVEIL